MPPDPSPEHPQVPAGAAPILERDVRQLPDGRRLTLYTHRGAGAKAPAAP